MAAIAGIAKYFADETGFTPILGIWKQTLLHDLLWTTHRPFDIPVKQQQSRLLNIPSWSIRSKGYK